MDKAELEKLLASVVRTDASTLHLAAGFRPSMRVKGRIVRAEREPNSAHSLEMLSREFLFEDHRTRLANGEDVEFLYASQDGVRFRTVIMRQAKGLTMVFHRIPTRISSLDELGMPPLVSGFCELSNGLVILTGFLGAGKSMTLAAMVNHINIESARHVVLIEHPIEFIHESKRSLIHQREVGFHVAGYAEGVREACRHGVDVIVVGEVRDARTMDAILDATEKGILVITTMHSSSVAAVISELQGLYAIDDRARFRTRLTGTLRVLMAQTLLKRLHNKGKVPLLEILINNSAVTRVIRSGQFQDLRETMNRNHGLGMQTVDRALRELLIRNQISEEEALYHAVDREAVLARRPMRIG